MNPEPIHPSSFILPPCALEGTRTPGLQVRNLSLYPLSYERMHGKSPQYYTPALGAVSRNETL